MEPLEVTCSCGKRYHVPMRYWGKRGKCPNCGNVMTVPFPGTAFESVDSDPGNRVVTSRKTDPLGQKKLDGARRPANGSSAAPQSIPEDSRLISDLFEYGGFWRRFLALIIDTLVWLFGSLIMTLVFKLAAPSVMDPSHYLTIAGRPIALYLAFFPFLFFLLHWTYYTIMESSAAMATLGKRCLGLVVTDLEGKGISFLRANGRYWSKVFISDLIPFLIGYLMAGWTRKKQAVHDLVAGTLVLKT